MANAKESQISSDGKTGSVQTTIGILDFASIIQNNHDAC